ncbi:hypothetical protein [Celeribacter sp.]|uniref:hypothetical protein n=1 Tax=Celeribacter sp. TaxID=1890673 RepID=UPI003A92D731
MDSKNSTEAQVDGADLDALEEELASIGNTVSKPEENIAPSIEPYAGQSREEVEAWFRWKYPKGMTEKGSGAYASELYKTRPDRNDDPAKFREWYERLSDYQCKILEDSKRQKAIKTDEADRIKFRDKYNLSDEESREYWKVRYQPKLHGERVSEWGRILDRLRKRKSLPPPKNKKRSEMTELEWKEHQRKLARERKAKSRAKRKAQEESGVRTAPLSEEEERVELDRLLLRMDESEAIADLESILPTEDEEQRDAEKQDALSKLPGFGDF